MNLNPTPSPTPRSRPFPFRRPRSFREWAISLGCGIPTLLFALFFCSAVFVGVAQGVGQGIGVIPTWTPSPTITPIPSSTPTPEPTPTNTPEPTNTPAPTDTPAPTNTPTPTLEPAAIAATEEAAAAATAEAEVQATAAAVQGATATAVAYDTDYPEIDIRDLVKGPARYEGQQLRLAGQVFNIREEVEGFLDRRTVTYIQMWVQIPGGGALDREAVMVRFENTLEGVFADDFIIVYGEGNGSFEGTNAMGASISQPLVEAVRIRY